MMTQAIENVELEPYTFPELARAYLDSLKGRASHDLVTRFASQWILHLKNCPTRRDVKARHAQLGPDGVPQTGDFKR